MPQWLRCGVGLLRSAGPARPATGLARCASPEGLPEVGPGLRQGHSSPGGLALKSSECKLALLRANYVLAPYGADAPSFLVCRAAARTRVCAAARKLGPCSGPLRTLGRRLPSGAPAARAARPPIRRHRDKVAGASCSRDWRERREQDAPATLTRTPDAGTPARNGRRGLFGADLFSRPLRLRRRGAEPQAPGSSRRLCVSARAEARFPKLHRHKAQGRAARGIFAGGRFA